MITTLKRCIAMLEGGKARWVGVIALGVVASGVEAFGAVLIFLVFKLVSDPGTRIGVPLIGTIRFAGPHRDTDLIVVCSLIGAFFVVRGLVLLLQVNVQYRMASNAAARISRRLFSGYLAMDYALLLRRNSPELIRNTNESVNLISNFALVPATTIAAEAMVILGMFAVLLVASPLATAIACASIGAFVLATMRMVQSHLGRLGLRNQESAVACLRALQEGLQGMKDVKLFGRRQGVVSEFSKHRDQLARTQYLQATLAAVPRLALETSFLLVIMAFLVVSGLSGNLKSGTIAIVGLFGYAMLRLMPAVNRIMLSVNNLKYGTAATDIVHGELMAIGPSEPPRQSSEQHWGSWRELTVQDVSYRYPETAWWAIEGIDLTFTRGEFVAFVGPTGSGKSTLLDVVVGLLRPTRGVVQVDGVDIHVDVDEWYRRVGVVSQTVFLVNDTLLQNIAFGVDEDEIDHERVEEVVQMARLEEFVSSLPDGLRTPVGEHAALLSGGQRQRVAIARALYRRPELLVLDEGTAALDNHTEREVMRALEPLRGDLTVVAAAHQMNTVRNCDRIVVIEGGRVSDEGSLQDVSARNGRLWLGTGGDHRSTASPSSSATHEQDDQAAALGLPVRAQGEAQVRNL